MTTTKAKEITLAAFRAMDSQERVGFYKADPLRYKQLMDEQARDALASLTAASTALRDMPDGGPLVVTLGPVSLPWAALLWQVSPETRLSVQQAAEALNLTTAAIYQLCATGKLPRVKLGGKLVFTAATLRTYIEQFEVHG